MKCFYITSKQVFPYIPAELIPCTQALLNIYPKGEVTNAIVVPSTKERDGLDFEKLFKESIHTASAVCSVVFHKETTANSSERILIAYDPKEFFLARKRGDKTDLVYRSLNCFVGIATNGNLFLRPIKSTPNSAECYTVVNSNIEKIELLNVHKLPEESDESNFIVTIK